MSVSAKISERTKRIAEELTVETGRKQIDVIEEAVVYYLHFWRVKMINDSFSAITKNTKAWRDLEKERKELDGTLSDGLEDE